MLRGVLRWTLVLPLLLPALAAADETKVAVELNTAKAADQSCQLTFVVANKGGPALETLKLDLVIFDQDNRAARRIVTEMAPLRVGKTVVRTYAVESPCAEVRGILVNDVTACAPATREECIDGLTLSSRVDGTRLFK